MSFTAFWLAKVCVGHRLRPDVARWLTPSERLQDKAVDADLRSLYSLVPGEALHEHLAFWEEPSALRKFYLKFRLLEVEKQRRILAYGYAMSETLVGQQLLLGFISQPGKG